MATLSRKPVLTSGRQPPHGEQCLDTLLGLISDLVLVLARDGTCLELQNAADTRLAVAPEQFLGKTLEELGFKIEMGHVADTLELAFTSGQVQHVECSVENACLTGRYQVRINALSDAEALMLVRDISEQVAMQATIEHYTLHDALTGLPNRHFLQRRFEQSQSKVGGKFNESAVLYVDLSRFKAVNDSLGHHQGDLLLIQVAERVRDVVRARDMVSRVGGDEFAFFLPEADEKTAVRVAERVMRTLVKPFTLDGGTFELGASLGMVVFKSRGSSFAEVMRRALMAMYRAKSNNGGIHFYDAEADERLRNKGWLEQALKEALRRETLALHYQPILQLRQSNLVAAEALLRWHHPEKGMISPGQFIPLAEETGIIKDLDRWVVKKAIQQAKEGGFNVAVNMSPLSLQDPGFIKHITTCLESSGLEASQLIIEITEQVLARPETTLATVEGLHKLGVQVAIDDFGTGYSSLSYLTSYPLDILKVDRGFVKNVNDDVKSRAIARSIIRLGQSLNLTTLAEGVETEAQLAWLKEEGCELAQGFYLERPMPFEALLNLLT